MYCIGDLFQLIQYIAFLVWQLTGLLMVITALLAVAFTDLPTFTNGQIGHLLHLVILGSSILGRYFLLENRRFIVLTWKIGPELFPQY